DWRTIGALVRVGAPYCLVVSMFSIVYLCFSHVAARFGSSALAVLGIGNRLESICYLSADGFAAAAAAMVGQNLGAGRPARAARSAWTAVGMMAACGGALMLLFLAAPAPLFAIFTRDPEVIARGTTYLRILALCQIATGAEGALAGACSGSAH